MSTLRMVSLRGGAREFLTLFLGCSLLTAVAYGQVDPPQPGTLADAISEVKQGNFSYVQQIVRIAGAEQAVPILQDLFAHNEDASEKDASTKAWIAGELVRLGARDDIYWNFVVNEARKTLESDAPDFMNLDPQAPSSAGPSPEFVAWAKAHNVSIESVAHEAVYPLKLGPLIRSGDARAIPLLRRGLLAPNHQVEAASAMGLVILKDRDSIPLIVEACKRSPAAAAPAIAMSLLQFHDAEAQSAAEPYLTQDMVKALHEGKE
jgi:hypothetical protein